MEQKFGFDQIDRLIGQSKFNMENQKIQTLYKAILDYEQQIYRT
ncbi:unnamed protein product [Paramecium octaurelia]|uniref:Uncharacterized protein n=1 Tax=Paramecium octaurelia TaxID=43137 RepID=A0A8S1UZU0_PAROT|nr:unnamed protein product [Paramecium octaurelia]CAD8167956.1 unnamed protein product [Paramecium octaurelia]